MARASHKSARKTTETEGEQGFQQHKEESAQLPHEPRKQSPALH